MKKSIFDYFNSPFYVIIKSIIKGTTKVHVFILKSIFALQKRRLGMKINSISTEDLANLIDVQKLKDLADSLSNIENVKNAIPFCKKEEPVVIVEKKSTPIWQIVVGVIIAIAAVCGIVFAVYKFCFDKDYDDEFLDDIDDEFEPEDDDDLFDDED